MTQELLQVSDVKFKFVGDVTPIMEADIKKAVAPLFDICKDCIL